MSRPPSPNPPGRPRALDEIKRREICALLSAGCGFEGAAAYVNCAASTIRREARRDKEFDEAIRRAVLAAELNPLNALRQAATRHWRAAAWMLERTNPYRYGRIRLRQLKPEHFELFALKLADALRREIDDPALARRVFRCIGEFGRRAKREAWHAERDHMSPTRTRKTKITSLPDGFLNDDSADDRTDSIERNKQ